MSKLYDFREGLKAAVVAADIGLAEEDVIIERQADVLNRINTVVAKKDANGVALTIGAGSGRVLDPDGCDLDEVVTFHLHLWVLPVYNMGTMPEEDIFEPLKKLLHGLDVSGENRHCLMDMRVVSWKEVPDPQYLVREIVLEQRIIF